MVLGLEKGWGFVYLSEGTDFQGIYIYGAKKEAYEGNGVPLYPSLYSNGPGQEVMCSVPKIYTPPRVKFLLQTLYKNATCLVVGEKSGHICAVKKGLFYPKYARDNTKYICLLPRRDFLLGHPSTHALKKICI